MTENLQKILDSLGIVYQQIGRKKDDGFNFIKDPANADENSLIFVNKPDETTLELLGRSHFSVVILEQKWGIKHLDKIKNLDISIFLVDNPRMVVTQIMRTLYLDDEQHFSGIHSTAQVHCNAEISATASIGAHAIIKDNVKISFYILDTFINKRTDKNFNIFCLGNSILNPFAEINTVHFYSSNKIIKESCNVVILVIEFIKNIRFIKFFTELGQKSCFAVTGICAY